MGEPNFKEYPEYNFEPLDSEGIPFWVFQLSAEHKSAFLASGALDWLKTGAAESTPPNGRIRIRFDPGSNSFVFTDELGADFELQRGYEARGRRSYLESEFIDFGNMAEGVVAVVAGAGAQNGPAVVDKTNHPGIWCLETGTTSVGRGFIISAATRGYHVGGGGITRTGSIVKTGVNLSTALEEYVDRVGFFSMALPNTINEGIGFEYQFDQNGGRWQGLCVDGSGETSVDLGVTVTAETWYDLELEVNKAGTSVQFFIDGVAVGTPITTNIPSGPSFDLFYNFMIMKLTGGANRSFYIDHYYIYQEVTR